MFLVSLKQLLPRQELLKTTEAAALVALMEAMALDV